MHRKEENQVCRKERWGNLRQTTSTLGALPVLRYSEFLTPGHLGIKESSNTIKACETLSKSFSFSGPAK